MLKVMLHSTLRAYTWVVEGHATLYLYRADPAEQVAKGEEQWVERGYATLSLSCIDDGTLVMDAPLVSVGGGVLVMALRSGAASMLLVMHPGAY